MSSIMPFPSIASKKKKFFRGSPLPDIAFITSYEMEWLKTSKGKSNKKNRNECAQKLVTLPVQEYRQQQHKLGGILLYPLPIFLEEHQEYKIRPMTAVKQNITYKSVHDFSM